MQPKEIPELLLPLSPEEAQLLLFSLPSNFSEIASLGIAPFLLSATFEFEKAEALYNQLYAKIEQIAEGVPDETL